MKDDDAWLEGGPLNDDPTIVDKHGLAAMLGEPVKVVPRYVKNGMPLFRKGKPGQPDQFRVPDCVKWLRTGTPIEEAKRRQAEAVARKREAEAARLEGESITVAEAEEVIRDGYAKVQARLLLIPPRFPEQRETLESEILAAINDLATLEVHHEQP